LLPEDAVANVAEGSDEINAFKAISMMLESMQENLEAAKITGDPQRWMRVARARDFRESVIGKGVVELSGGFIKVIGILAELVMKAQDIILQIDSGVALMEVGIKMIETATDEKFLNTVQSSVGIDPPEKIPGADVANAGVKNVMKFMKYIPDPKDLDEVAEVMYRLLAVEEIDLVDPDNPKKPTTGKVRLLSWALDKPIAFHGLKDGVDVSRLGIDRRADEKDNHPFKLAWKDNGNELIIYEYDKNDVQTTSNKEANSILDKLGYGPGKLDTRLKSFQKANALGENGKLDLPTINRLMNLDFEDKKLSRAKPFNEDIN
jgi:hypothetical protein